MLFISLLFLFGDIVISGFSTLLFWECITTGIGSRTWQTGEYGLWLEFGSIHLLAIRKNGQDWDLGLISFTERSKFLNE